MLIHMWTNILEDVMQSPYVLDLKRKLVQESFTHKEFTSLSIDATIRLMRRVKGQEDYRAPAEVRNDAPIPDTEAKRRILSIVGRTGATIGLPLVTGESSPEIARVLMESLSSACSEQTIAVASDQCTPLLYLEWKQVCKLYDSHFGQCTSADCVRTLLLRAKDSRVYVLEKNHAQVQQG